MNVGCLCGCTHFVKGRVGRLSLSFKGNICCTNNLIKNISSLMPTLKFVINISDTAHINYNLVGMSEFNSYSCLSGEFATSCITQALMIAWAGKTFHYAQTDPEP